MLGGLDVCVRGCAGWASETGEQMAKASSYHHCLGTLDRKVFIEISLVGFSEYPFSTLTITYTFNTFIPPPTPDNATNFVGIRRHPRWELLSQRERWESLLTLPAHSHPPLEPEPGCCWTLLTYCLFITFQPPLHGWYYFYRYLPFADWPAACNGGAWWDVCTPATCAGQNKLGRSPRRPYWLHSRPQSCQSNKAMGGVWGASECPHLQGKEPTLSSSTPHRRLVRTPILPAWTRFLPSFIAWLIDYFYLFILWGIGVGFVDGYCGVVVSLECKMWYWLVPGAHTVSHSGREFKSLVNKGVTKGHRKCPDLRSHCVM